MQASLSLCRSLQILILEAATGSEFERTSLSSTAGQVLLSEQFAVSLADGKLCVLEHGELFLQFTMHNAQFQYQAQRLQFHMQSSRHVCGVTKIPASTMDIFFSCNILTCREV